VSNETPLIRAAANGNTHVMQHLIDDHNADINASDLEVSSNTEINASDLEVSSNS
jgi:hypothetical protein